MFLTISCMKSFVLLLLSTAVTMACSSEETLASHPSLATSCVSPVIFMGPCHRLLRALASQPALVSSAWQLLRTPVNLGFSLNFFYYVLLWNEESIEVVRKPSSFAVAQRCLLFCSVFLSQYFLAFNCSCDSYWALNCPHRTTSSVQTCFILLSWFLKR